MKGFIVASVNKKVLRNSSGLESQLIRYTPGVGDDQESVAKQFEDAFPDHMVVLTMPVDVLKKNIEVLEKIAKQKEMSLN